MFSHDRLGKKIGHLGLFSWIYTAQRNKGNTKIIHPRYQLMKCSNWKSLLITYWNENDQCKFKLSNGGLDLASYKNKSENIGWSNFSGNSSGHVKMGLSILWPHACMPTKKFLQRLAMLLIQWIVSWGIPSQVRIKASVSSWKVCGAICHCCMEQDMMSQICLMGHFSLKKPGIVMHQKEARAHCTSIWSHNGSDDLIPVPSDS